MPGGLFTDFYELTMGAGYHAADMAELPATFDLFFRDLPETVDLAILAGVEPVVEYLLDWSFKEADIEYLRNLGMFENDYCDRLADLRFTGDLHAVREGTPVYPTEPVLRVDAPLLQAQLIETALINRIAHSSLIASHAAQIVASAQGKDVLEFGARRAHGPNGALTGSRAAMIGGCSATSLTEAGHRFGAEVSGTQAHSWIMAFEDELAAFRAYARTFPDASVLLVDTYDTVDSGVPNAITVARELREAGHELQAIRLDSGDLGALAEDARRQLDQAGFSNVRILASGDLNAARITELEEQQAPIDAYGVGTELAVARPDPAFTAVYKLAHIADRAAMKLSATPAKMTDPGIKQVWRSNNEDVIGLAEEALPGEPLLQPVLQAGVRVANAATLSEIIAYSTQRTADIRGQDWTVSRSPDLEKLRSSVIERYE